MKDEVQLKKTIDVFLDAVREGNTLLFEALLEPLTKKVDISELVNEDGCNPLHLAAMFGHIQLARALAEKYPKLIESTIKNGSTPIVLAMLNKQHEVFIYLMNKNANPAVTSKEGANCFTLAANLPEGHALKKHMQEYTDLLNKQFIEAVKKEQVELVEEWLVKGANIETPLSLSTDPKINNTALFYAASMGNEKLVKLLIDRKANLNVIGAKNGFTPLHAAAYFNSPAIVGLLLNAKAELKQDVQEMTPLDIAKKRGLKAIIEQFVIKPQAPISVSSSTSQTPSRTVEVTPSVEGDTNRFMPAPAEKSAPKKQELLQVSLVEIREKILALSKTLNDIEQSGGVCINGFNQKCIEQKMKFKLDEFEKYVSDARKSIQILHATFIDASDVAQMSQVITKNYKIKRELGKLENGTDNFYNMLGHKIIVSYEYGKEHSSMFDAMRTLRDLAKKLGKRVARIHEGEAELISDISTATAQMN